MSSTITIQDEENVLADLVINNTPDTIYLNIGDLHTEITSEFDFQQLEDDVTWCTDKQGSCDIEYIRNDLHNKQIKELTEELEAIKTKLKEFNKKPILLEKQNKHIDISEDKMDFVGNELGDFKILYNLWKKREFPKKIMKELELNYAELDDIVLSFNGDTNTFDIGFVVNMDTKNPKIIYKCFYTIIEDCQS